MFEPNAGIDIGATPTGALSTSLMLIPTQSLHNRVKVVTGMKDVENTHGNAQIIKEAVNPRRTIGNPDEPVVLLDTLLSLETVIERSKRVQVACLREVVTLMRCASGVKHTLFHLAPLTSTLERFVTFHDKHAVNLQHPVPSTPGS